MTKTCIKCGHTRRASDPGPDYACPSCGIVYAKAEAAQAEREAAAQARAASQAALRARLAAEPAPRREAAAPPVAATTSAPGQEALVAQLMAAQAGQPRQSPYRGMALVALVAFAVGFASAAGLYSGLGKAGKAQPRAAQSCPK